MTIHELTARIDGGDVIAQGRPEIEPRDDVCFLGLRNDVASLMQACDVVVLASRIPEACPLVVLEAQAAGVPVVASRIGGVAEIVVEDETAFLVEPEDASALATAIDRALREAKLGASLSHPAIAAVLDYGFAHEFSYTVFEFVEGDRLRDLLDRRGALPTTANETTSGTSSSTASTT